MNIQTDHKAFATVAAIGRVLLATIFLLSGLSKLTAPAGTIGYIASTGLPFPELAYAGAVLVEVAVAMALVVGYQTRIAATVIAVFSLATAFGFHFNLADQNQFIHFFKNVAIAGGLLQIVAYGGGGLSVDGWQARTSRRDGRTAT